MYSYESGRTPRQEIVYMENPWPIFRCHGRENAVGKRSKNALRVYFGRKLNLEFHGPKAACDTGV